MHYCSDVCFGLHTVLLKEKLHHGCLFSDQSLCVLNCWSLLIITPMNKPLMASFSALRWLWTGLDSAMLQLLSLEGLWGTREKVKAHTGLNSQCIA